MSAECPTKSDVRKKMKNVFTKADGTLSVRKLWLNTFFRAVLRQYAADVVDKCEERIFDHFIQIIDKEDPPYRDGLKIHYVL